MKVNVAVLVFFALICVMFTEKNYAQASLQEIVRFSIPVGESFCSNVEAGGDINGDGRPDLLFSCIDEMQYSNAPVYIYYSLPDNNAMPDQILTTPYPFEGGFGYSIAYRGDLNGDGISDLVIGIKHYNYRLSGALLIYYGGNPPFTVPDVFISGVGLGYTHSWDLFFSEDIITDCDVNGDGINDLLVYAPGPQYENWGNVYVFLGGEFFSTTPVLHIRGNQYYEYLGADMKTGDINGDGFDDIILTNRVPVNQQSPSGPSHYSLKIYPGGETLTNVAVYDTLLGTAPELYITGIIANGDLNGDGCDDIVVSCGSQNGQAWLKVIYGQSDLTDLDISDYYLPEITHGFVMSYCNLDNDAYSDFSFMVTQMSNDILDFWRYSVFKQESEQFDTQCDFLNPGGETNTAYGFGYPLNDFTGDGFPDFLVYSMTTINPVMQAYGTILSENFVSNSDELIHQTTVKVHCYPNPFRDGVNISVLDPNKTIQLASIEIYNIKGQLVYNRCIQNEKHINWDGLDNNGILTSSGIFMIKVSDSKGNIYTTKVVNLK